MFFVFAFTIDQSFHNIENNTMKLPLNEAKLTGLWARNRATFQKVWMLKFAFESEKFPGLSRNGSQVECRYKMIYNVTKDIFHPTK